MVEILQAESAIQVTLDILFIFLGLLIAIYQRRLFNLPISLALFYYAWHTVFSLAYLQFTIGRELDAEQYYLYSKSISEYFSLGTVAVYYFTSIFSVYLDMSFLGCFLVFNLIGYLGMAAFAGSLREVSVGKSNAIILLATFIPLLPGVSFWSSMIGKDAISFLGAGLLCWSSLDLRRRFAAFAIAAILFTLVRPYIGSIILVSFTISILIFGRIGLINRMLILLMSVPAAFFIISYTLDVLQLGYSTSTSDIGEFVEGRQTANMEGGSSIDIANMSIPLRLLSYLYRPLFVDANGILGAIASSENLALLGLSIAALFKLRFRIEQFSSIAQSFLVVYCFSSWIVLANTTANLGLASRQKWMILPILLLLIVALLSAEARKGSRATQATGPTRPQSPYSRQRLLR